MFNTYDNYANQTRSSKVVLCHIEPKQRHAVFTLDTGSVYKKQMQYFVIGVSQNGIDLVKGSSQVLSAGEFFYDSVSGELFVRMSDDSDPKTKKVISTYRLFYANTPIDLPYDLESGEEVNYDGRLSGNSPINKDLDDEQIGIVLETTTNIQLENTDGYFDDFYDVLIFENKDIKLYSWHENLLITEKVKLFEGVIQNKSISTSKVSFSCKDFTLKLREPVFNEKFSDLDGDVPDRYLNKSKRRLFGRFQKLQCTPIDAVKDGFVLTGTISGVFNTDVFAGSGTQFLKELSPEDEIIYETANITYKFSVKQVVNDTSVVLTEALPISIPVTSVKINPKYNYRFKNRRFSIAGHKLRAPTTTVTQAIDKRRIIVDDVSDFFAGDLIDVNGESAYITRISNSQITLESSLQSGLPSVLDPVSKNPLSSAYINGVKIFIDRDWSVENNVNNSVLVLDDLAEFNTTAALTFNYDLDFTGGSRSVTVTGADVSPEVKPRDWIRSDDITYTTWHEVLDVTFNSGTGASFITLRAAYGGSSIIATEGQIKRSTAIDDNAIVTVDCIGKEDATGKWIKTASDAVRDMLENDAGITALDLASFDEAKLDAPFALSYAVPDKIGGSNKSIRDSISDINKSVFGSLVTDNDFNLKYEVLTVEKPTDMVKIEEDDLAAPEFTARSRNEIVRAVNARYAHFVDGFNGSDAFDLYSFENEFVDDLIGIKSELDIDVYLFDLDNAKTIAQRYAFYNSLSQSTITIRGKLNLYSYVLNSKVYLSLDRLYRRFGNLSKLKIGIVNKISNNGSDVTLELNDLGNAYNRAANISDNSTNDYSAASEDEKIKYSWVVDDDIETPSSTSDAEIYGNLIN